MKEVYQYKRDLEQVRKVVQDVNARKEEKPQDWNPLLLITQSELNQLTEFIDTYCTQIEEEEKTYEYNRTNETAKGSNR